MFQRRASGSIKTRGDHHTFCKKLPLEAKFNTEFLDEIAQSIWHQDLTEVSPSGMGGSFPMVGISMSCRKDRVEPYIQHVTASDQIF
jgi:hypothetical protein